MKYFNTKVSILNPTTKIENKSEPKNLKIVFLLTIGLVIIFYSYVILFLRYPVGLIELIFLTALVPLAYFAKKGNRKAYTILRISFWFIWVITATLVAIFLLITKGDFQSVMFSDSLGAPAELKRMGIYIIGTFVMQTIAFVISVVSYFLLTTKSVAAYFRKSISPTFGDK